MLVPSRLCDRRTALALLGGTSWTLASAGWLQAEPDQLPTLEQRLQRQAREAPLALTFQGSTADEARSWQASFRQALVARLGPADPPAQWQARLERSVPQDTFTREEWLLEAEGLDPVPFHLLIPERRSDTPLPLVMALHGHGIGGHDAVAGVDDQPEVQRSIKSANYDYGRQLARLGYAVAIPCLLPFGRRRDARLEQRSSDICGGTFAKLLSFGKLLIAENLRDVRWTLAQVERDARIETRRLACVGLSYGGRMTMLYAALEPRVALAVVSGALNAFQERLQIPGWSAGCQTIPGLLEIGDVAEIASLIAPRWSVWETGGADKLIDPAWAERLWGRMARVYRALGVEERLIRAAHEGGHRWDGVEAERLMAREFAIPK